MEKIRWGILSTAKIGREKVIPAIQKSKYCQVVAIASRNMEQAQSVADLLQIPTAYASYGQLLGDPHIDAVYIPLPNHMHVQWSIKALQAGKHVLVEKPMGISAAECELLVNASAKFSTLLVMEAFMYKFHPQWKFVMECMQQNRIGELKTIQSFFSYHNIDMNNIRNRKDAAGGGLMDIGCYCISWSRMLFGGEPTRVISTIDFNPQSQTDSLASAILHFPNGTSSFTCSTQLMPYQRVNILGTEGRIEIEIPVNAPVDSATRVWVHTKAGNEEKVFEAVDQYQLQCDYFSEAIMQKSDMSASLWDSINNMKVIDAIFISAENNCWLNL